MDECDPCTCVQIWASCLKLISHSEWYCVLKVCPFFHISMLRLRSKVFVHSKCYRYSEQLCPLRKQPTFRGYHFWEKRRLFHDPEWGIQVKPQLSKTGWRYGIHWINLYPVDNAFGFPITYPLDGDLSSGYIALSNVWTKNRDLSAVWLLGEYPRPQTDFGMVYGISNSRSESVTECWGMDGT